MRLEATRKRALLDDLAIFVDSVTLIDRRIAWSVGRAAIGQRGTVDWIYWHTTAALGTIAAVSYDIHLARFVHGKPESRQADRVYELLADAVNEPADQHEYSRVVWHGGEADLYGMPESAQDQVGSITFSRPSGDERIFDLIFQVADAGEMVVLLPDGEACLTDPQQAQHLPDDVRAWPRHQIDSGSALAAVINSI
jgi:hypothetical protein